MTNKQLAVIVVTILLAVVLAYQLFVGFDFRSEDQRRLDKVSEEQDEFLSDSTEQACADIRAAGGECQE